MLILLYQCMANKEFGTYNTKKHQNQNNINQLVSHSERSIKITLTNTKHGK